MEVLRVYRVESRLAIKVGFHLLAWQRYMTNDNAYQCRYKQRSIIALTIGRSDNLYSVESDDPSS